MSGVITSIASGFLNGLGYTVQRRVLVNTEANHLLSITWWFGLSLLLIAETLGGVATVLVPASVVVALSSVSVLTSAVLAAFTEPCRTGLVLGTAAVIAGSVLFGISIPNSDAGHDFQADVVSWASLAYHVAAIALCIPIHIWGRQNIVSLAAYAGLVSSLTAIWYRPLVALFLQQAWDVFATSPLPYLSILVLAVSGPYAAAYLEPLGLRQFPQTEWIPVHFVSCLLFFTLAGEVVFMDWQRQPFHPRMLLHLPIAFVNVVLGVAIIAKRI